MAATRGFGAPWDPIVAVVAAGAVVAIGASGNGMGMPDARRVSTALTQNSDAYTLSLGHIQDFTLQSFAYFRHPLMLAGIALLIGAIGAWRLRGQRAILAMAVMMVIFFQAARLALVTFDPYLSSRPIAEALKRAPRGQLIIYGNHNAISSLLFYTEDKCLMLNGRYFNLEYGSYAPDAPPVFINDDDFSRLWSQPERWYLALERR